MIVRASAPIFPDLGFLGRRLPEGEDCKTGSGFFALGLMPVDGSCPPKQFERLEGHCPDWMMYRAAWCFSQPRTGKWIKSASCRN